jgi:N-acetylglucosaminyl-diphospho-decaprenol L-rhamnosyltransferase
MTATEDRQRGDVVCITVTYRSEVPLRSLLRSLTRHEPKTQIVVVDNATPGGPPAVPDAVALVPLPTNLGYGAACNAGVAASPGKSDYLAFLNPDLELRGPTLTTLATEMAGRPDVGIAVGPVVDATGVRVASAWGRPSAARAFWAATGWHLPRLRALLGRFVKRGPSQSGASVHDRVLEVEGHVLGGAMLVRRTCFEHLQGFDESFFLFWEDADLCARAREAGWRVMMLPAPPVVHVEGTSSDGVTESQRWMWYRQGATTYAERHLSPRRRRTLGLVMDLGELVGRRRR